MRRSLKDTLSSQLDWLGVTVPASAIVLLLGGILTIRLGIRDGFLYALGLVTVGTWIVLWRQR